MLKICWQPLEVGVEVEVDDASVRDRAHHRQDAQARPAGLPFAIMAGTVIVRGHDHCHLVATKSGVLGTVQGVMNMVDLGEVGRITIEMTLLVSADSVSVSFGF